MYFSRGGETVKYQNVYFRGSCSDGINVRGLMFQFGDQCDREKKLLVESEAVCPNSTGIIEINYTEFFKMYRKSLLVCTTN